MLSDDKMRDSVKYLEKHCLFRILISIHTFRLYIDSASYGIADVVQEVKSLFSKKYDSRKPDRYE